MTCQVDANLAAAGFSASDFDAVVAADKFEAIKPAPDIFLAAARLMGVPPQACVVVEDAAAGIQAARNAGGCWLSKTSGCSLGAGASIWHAFW
jgi:HAD superfamily hydrolase (TIGR01509 family)